MWTKSLLVKSGEDWLPWEELVKQEERVCVCDGEEWGVGRNGFHGRSW